MNGRLRVRKAGNGFAAVEKVCVTVAAAGFSTDLFSHRELYRSLSHPLTPKDKGKISVKAQ